MADENQMERLKKEAAARAKAAALAKLKRENEQSEKTKVNKEPKDGLGPKVKISAKAEMPKDVEKTKAMDEVEKTKAIAIAKAKAAVLSKTKLSQQPKNISESSELTIDEKAKAIALSKVKAIAAAKVKLSVKQSENMDEALPVDEKTKAIAKAKAEAIAAAKEKLAAQQLKNGIEPLNSIDNEKTKTIAITKAKIVAAEKVEGNTPLNEDTYSNEMNEVIIEISSVNQPLLDFVKKETIATLGSNVIEDSYINKLSKDVPTFLIEKSNFLLFAKFLKENKSLQFEYLNLLLGTDFKTHFEVYVHLHSYRNGYEIALKTKLYSENPEMDSLTSIWTGASWPESEAYDLLGIKFNGNPDLHRIFLGENWVGYPLRKDYQPYDEEVASE